MVTVLDDVIPQHVQDNVINLLKSNRFPWFYHDVMEYNAYELTNPEITPSSGLFHGLWIKGKDNSSFSKHFLAPLNYFLESQNLTLDRLLRIKANLTFPITGYKDGQYAIPHIDDDSQQHYVMIYYPHDSDGDTFVFNEGVSLQGTEVSLLTRVTPKKGRIVFFEGDRFHCASNPITNSSRMIVNYNFTLK